MKLRRELRDHRTVLHLSGALTANGVAEAQRTLLAALADVDDGLLDLSALHRIDGLGLQLLVLAKREALREGRRLQLGGLSVAAREALERCGLVGYFRDEDSVAHFVSP